MKLSQEKQHLDGTHFYQLFKHHFRDFDVPLKDFGVIPQNLNYDFGLYKTTVKVVSYYAGWLNKESRITKVYHGPTAHHNRKLMKILNSKKIERLIENTTPNMCDWQAREDCYQFISHLGLE